MKNPLKIVYFKDNKGKYRVRLMRSGRITFVSGEGYERRESVVKALHNTFKAIRLNEFVTLPDA